MSQKHKLTLSGTLAFLHAITVFATEWQKENEQEEDTEIVAAVVTPSVSSNQFVSGTNVPVQDPASLVAPAAPEKKARPSRAKAKQPEETAPVAATETPATPGIPLPDWLNSPSSNPFAAATENVQPWLNEPATTSPAIPTAQNLWAPPVITPVAAASWPAQQAPQVAAAPVQAPGLSELHLLAQSFGTPAQRTLAGQYLASRNASDLTTLSPDLYGEAINVFTQIINGQIQ